MNISREQRFFNKIRIEDSCWIWTAYKTRKGYGQFQITTKQGMAAHRFAWQMVNGPIPVGMQIDHLCRDQSCVNPLHLDLVTLEENRQRSNSTAVLNAKKTYCKYGHPFDETNTYVCMNSGKPMRQCRICSKKRIRAFYTSHPTYERDRIRR